jgi:hypothetical protein
MECPFTEIKHKGDLHAFLFWFFQNVKTTARPKVILNYLEKNDVEVYYDFKPAGMSSVLRRAQYIGVDDSSTQNKYYLKEEFT